MIGIRKVGRRVVASGCLGMMVAFGGPDVLFAQDSASVIEALTSQVQQLQSQQEETQRQLKTLTEEFARLKGLPGGARMAEGTAPQPSENPGNPEEKGPKKEEDEYFDITTAGAGSSTSSTSVSSLAQRLDIHGYLDLEYFDNRQRGTSGNSTFDNHHLTLWSGWKISDMVYAKAEIEYEHANGISEGRSAGDRGDIKVETAQIDITPLNNTRFSLGAFIVPFGIEGEAHASPINRLVTRPTVARQIIRGTWTDVGVWANQTVPGIGELALYMINGDGRNGGVNRDTQGGGNDGKTLGGRLRFNQLVNGLDMGVSLANGKHDPNNDSRSTRFGLHLATDLRQWLSLSRELSLRGEWLFGRDEKGSTVGPVGDKRDARLQGWYLQLVKGLSQDIEAIVRYGQYDEDQGISDNLKQELSVGLGYKLFSNMKLKLEYQWNMEEGPRRASNNLIAGQAVVNW